MYINQLIKISSKFRRASRVGLLSSTSLSHKFEFETLEPRVLMSADLLPVHGSIDVPGETDRYTFNLPAAADIYFDSQTPHSSAINWSLSGPRGAEITNRSFESS